MPTYIIQGRYTQEALKGLLARPEDRSVEISKLLAAFGGRMLAYYVTLGQYDFLVISEAPDLNAAISAVLVTASGGGVTDMHTTIAMTAAEAKDAFANAAKVAVMFRPAGS
jgi:uncharacterized protein with GYD domain